MAPRLAIAVLILTGSNYSSALPPDRSGREMVVLAAAASNSGASISESSADAPQCNSPQQQGVAAPCEQGQRHGWIKYGGWLAVGGLIAVLAGLYLARRVQKTRID